jgi:hypothetical protein
MAKKKTINVTISRKKNKKSVWFYVFAVLFYPITLMVLMWKSKKISLKTKKTITAIAGGFIVLLPIFALLSGEPTQKSDTINRSLPTTTTATEETIDIEKELALIFDITTADALADTTASETTITDITTISEIIAVTEPPRPVTTRVITTQQIEYILNTNSGIWHYPSCHLGARIKDENRYYTTDKDYLINNYDGCDKCTGY